MNYFIAKTVETEFTRLSFVAPFSSTNDGPGAIIHRCFDRVGDTELHGIDYQGELDVQVILDLQHPECECEEVTFESVADRLKACRFASEINADTVGAIRSQYSVDTELKIMKMDPASLEYLQMIAWIDDCRSVGNAQKIAMGIKQ